MPLSREFEYELTHTPENTEATMDALRYIQTPDEITVLRDSARYPYLPTQGWSMDRNTKRVFFTGNGHGDIARFIPVLQRIRALYEPITTVSFDEHKDDKVYSSNKDLFSSWQWYLQKVLFITNRANSYTVQPMETVTQSSTITQQLIVEAFREIRERIQFDIMSVDLDILNDLMPQAFADRPEVPPQNVARGDLIRQTMKNTILSSKSVMVFVSPIFTKHGFEQDVLRELYNATIHKPMDPREYLKTLRPSTPAKGYVM